MLVVTQKKEAISFRDRRYTYQEFNERINQLGHAMKNIGIQKGDKVAFMLYNCNELCEIMYACSKIGAVFVPINSRFVGPEIKHVLTNSESVAIIYDHRFVEEIKFIQNEVGEVKKLYKCGWER